MFVLIHLYLKLKVSKKKMDEDKKETILSWCKKLE